MKPLLSRGVPPRAVLPVLALALIASVVIGREKPAEVVAAVDVQPERTDRAANVARQEMVIDLERLQQREMHTVKTDPFAPLPVEQAATAPNQPAPAPQAPALPFVYLGKMIDGEKTAVFVAKGDENYSLAAGQTVAGEYRVEKITDTEVTFTYLPMKKRQKLSLIQTAATPQ
jgi:type IV pilus biogenesis protein PilP